MTRIIAAGGQQQFKPKNILVNTKEEADLISQLQQGKKFADSRRNGQWSDGPERRNLG
jgi:hypothetical protein